MSEDEFQSCAWCGDPLELMEMFSFELGELSGPRFCESCLEEKRSREDRDG